MSSATQMMTLDNANIGTHQPLAQSRVNLPAGYAWLREQAAEAQG